MRKKDEVAHFNERHWENAVAEGCGFCIPWLDLDADCIRQYASGQPESVGHHLDKIYPAEILVDAAGKDVLCLAAGGGQQSAIFGVLGAQVTVVDFSEGQLKGDREAAAHYGYKIETIRADMRDLSQLADASFDLVYQGPSMSWIPDVREVYAGVARVLRPGGRYRTDFGNPANHFLEWDGEAYRITAPYAEKLYRHEDGAYDFRHYLGDIFNGLLTAGFALEQVQDHPYSQPDLSAQPGSWSHYLAYDVGFAVVARKAD